MSGCRQRSNYLKSIPRVFRFSGIATFCSVQRTKTAKIPMCFAKLTSAVLHRILNLRCLTLLMRQRFGYKQRDSDAASPDNNRAEWDSLDEELPRSKKTEFAPR